MSGFYQRSIMPKTGSFLTVWEANGSIWSGSYRWNCSKLYRYDEVENEWSVVSSETPIFFEKGFDPEITYLVSMD